MKLYSIYRKPEFLLMLYQPSTFTLAVSKQWCTFYNIIMLSHIYLLCNFLFRRACSVVFSQQFPAKCHQPSVKPYSQQLIPTPNYPPCILLLISPLHSASSVITAGKTSRVHVSTGSMQRNL